MSPEQRARAEALLDDGAPFGEVAETLGVQSRTVARHFPGRGWTKQEGGTFSGETRWLLRSLGLTNGR